MIRGESKVTRAHLERAAIVYVRQSTLMQVREHTESTRRQYDLAGQAARLGWAAGDIEVIDADLGLSGRSASYRDGFKQLVARVCLGEAGAVFGLEVSRLARSNADLARLLELARSVPKGMKWKLRANVGDRVRWYELPEEVGH